jgi:hypothetical protein
MPFNIALYRAKSFGFKDTAPQLTLLNFVWLSTPARKLLAISTNWLAISGDQGT